jgi:hypothetical protein
MEHFKVLLVCHVFFACRTVALLARHRTSSLIILPWVFATTVTHHDSYPTRLEQATISMSIASGAIRDCHFVGKRRSRLYEVVVVVVPFLGRILAISIPVVAEVCRRRVARSRRCISLALSQRRC